MWKVAFKGIYLVHALVLVLAAIVFFRFWARARFWLPKYVHVLAGVGFVILLWVLSLVPADAPVNHWGALSRFLFALVMPAIVYFFFVFYGGQRAAFDRSVATQLPYPFCGQPVTACPANTTEPASTARFLDQTCAHCGQTLIS